jgi:flagellar basal body-associated protein FliL
MAILALQTACFGDRACQEQRAANLQTQAAQNAALQSMNASGSTTVIILVVVAIVIAGGIFGYFKFIKKSI